MSLNIILAMTGGREWGIERAIRKGEESNLQREGGKSRSWFPTIKPRSLPTRRRMDDYPSRINLLDSTETPYVSSLCA